MSAHTAHSSERPERSRNAKAQARHRAKRKAYIDTLEQTVTKLQIAVGLTSEQMSALPPPSQKIRELEIDNARLLKENDELRRLLADPNARVLPSDSMRRSVGSYHDSRSSDREYKRRKAGQDGVYISPGDTPPHVNETLRPPPPLTIPQPLSHSYGGSGMNSSHSATATSSLFGGGSLHAPTTFQMPNTPSGSSATSSPPFSPIQMQTSSHLPMDHHNQHHHRSAHGGGGMSDHHPLSSYSQTTSHYSNGSVKVEDDHYNNNNHPGQHSPMQYSPYSGTQSQSHNGGGMDWHSTYSSDRHHLHR